MNLKQILITSLLFIAISIISITTYHFCFQKKTAYIEIKKVFNAFVLKKELEEKYTQTAKTRAKIIDSLSFRLQILSKELQSNKENKDLLQHFEIKRAEYFKAKNEFEEDNAALSQKYDSQILEQMTQYVVDYGKKGHYTYIYGAEGNGTLMYANENANISDDVIMYINNRYKGLE